MTVWVDALPAVLAAVGVLVLPGLAAALALGLRGVTAFGVAPSLSVGTIAVAAVGLPLVGIPWGVGAAAGAGLAVVAAALTLDRLLLRRRRPRPGRGEPASTLVVAALGLLAAAYLIGRVVARGITLPDRVSQTFDAVFHLNAVRFVLDTGNASSWHVGGLVRPTEGAGFYPAAWHAVVALVVDVVGVPIPVATNAVALAVAAVVWPASAMVLIRVVLGGNVVALLGGAVLAAGFLGLPSLLLSFGVLYPNLLGFSLLPAVLAVVLVVLRRAQDDPAGVSRSCAVLPLGVAGLGLAHPNAVFSLAVMALPPALSTAVDLSRGGWRSGRSRVILAAWASALAVVALTGAVLTRSTLLAGVTQQDWAALVTVPQATGEVLLLGLAGRDAFPLLAALVLAGAVLTLRSGPARWLVVSYALVGWLYVLARGSDTGLSATLTGLWFNDSFRFAGLLPVLGVPLATVTVVAVVRIGQDLLARRARLTVPALPVVATVLVLLLVLTGGLYVDRLSTDLSRAYVFVDDPDVSYLLTVSEHALFSEIGSYVPEDAVVAGNPWNGSALVSALGDRQVAFPYFAGDWGPARETLMAGMRDVATDPEVCAAARELGVEYVVDGGRWLVEGDPRGRRFEGFEDLGRAPGLERVVRYGQTTLYRVVECAGG